MKQGNILFFTGNKGFPNGDVGVVVDTNPNQAFWLSFMELIIFDDDPKYVVVGPPVLGKWL